MAYQSSVGVVNYRFADLRELLAKATPLRSGDHLAGLAADSAQQRVAACQALPDLPLITFVQQAVVPYESDAVTRLGLAASAQPSEQQRAIFAPRRPDPGRRLDAASAARLLEARRGMSAQTMDQPFDLTIVLADGLSAQATQQHALALRSTLELGPALSLAPLVIAEQARVVLADEVGALLQTRVVLILLGERPGLSSPDSLGAYLTHAPAIGITDAMRNCVSNIRPAGLPYA